MAGEKRLGGPHKVPPAPSTFFPSPLPPSPYFPLPPKKNRATRRGDGVGTRRNSDGETAGQGLQVLGGDLGRSAQARGRPRRC